MFDPTAFDNMKVIVEGMLYDKDLDGEYLIIDRDDLMNMSKMNRQFSMQFKKKNTLKNKISCKFTLSTTAKDLYSELLESNGDVGCFVELEFFFYKEIQLEFLQRSLMLLQNHTNQQFSVFHNIKQSFFDKNKTETSLIIKFENKITEDDFDKLEELIHISEIMLQWFDEKH